MTETLVIHYLELSLKGKNRPWFIERLVRSIRVLVADQDVSHVRHVQGRIEARLGANANWAEIRSRLAGLPGIANFAKATQIDLTRGAEATSGIDAMWEAMRPMLDGRTPASFRVKVRRVNKQFPIESPAVERALGERVIAATGWRVDLSNPALTLWVEALGEHALVYADREPGAGGLPIGTGGKVLCLLSGGIDSPVAAWRMMRRGCTALFVHFHAYPILSIASQEKARELVQTLTRRQLKSKLFLVPFGALQQQVVLSVPPPLRVIIYRRFMVRIAEEIARRANALALVTGDVVGQVASQTLENIVAVNQVATMPILRPLISCDKEEITAEAREIGTYGTSILEDQDCCTLFTPELPSTRTTLRLVEEAEQALDVPALVAMALEGVTLESHGVAW
ncbi:MAG: tRNA 4-thiouridine(8) synthase ThiI [Acidobacteria bacterium]|nr:MAG: tRNA 4-thiouridine(8) synthase ThiI [Acidobacteriota bacterium]